MMDSTQQFPRGVRLAIELLEKHGPLGMVGFSAHFDSNARRESDVHGYRCLLTMREDGLVELKENEEGQGLFHVTEKARELVASGKI